jgi:hypothetical protein
MEFAHVYNITAFRDNIADIVKQVSSTGESVGLAVRKNIKAVLMPDRYNVLNQPEVEYTTYMAFMFTDKFLPGAPDYLRDPQFNELVALPLKRLQVLLEVKKLPVRGKLKQKVESTLGKELLHRLERRHKIAKLVSDAEKQGLYEAAEHLTSNVDFS